MAWNKNLDIGKPPDTAESPSLGASRIRDWKNAVCERLTNWIYSFKTDDTEIKEGLKKAPFNTGSAPSQETNKVIVYAKDVAGKAELFARDEDGDEIQLTSGGANYASPPGIITMWSGTIANIPTGWALCDGAGGRPDLRDKFILGAPDGVDPGDTGGSHNITLATANLPAHTHGSAGAHTHKHLTRSGNTDSPGGENRPLISTATLDTDSAGAHTHTSVGSGTAFDNRPAFYKLAYIMKL